MLCMGESGTGKVRQMPEEGGTVDALYGGEWYGEGTANAGGGRYGRCFVWGRVVRGRYGKCQRREVRWMICMGESGRRKVRQMPNVGGTVDALYGGEWYGEGRQMPEEGGTVDALYGGQWYGEGTANVGGGRNVGCFVWWRWGAGKVRQMP